MGSKRSIKDLWKHSGIFRINLIIRKVDPGVQPQRLSKMNRGTMEVDSTPPKVLSIKKISKIFGTVETPTAAVPF